MTQFDPEKQCLSGMLKKYVFLLLLISFSGGLFAQTPVINSFSPAAGPVGSTVTITGSGFNGNPYGDMVFFGGVMASISAATSTSLTVVVPSGATYQPLSVNVGGLIAFSANPFITTFSDPGQFNPSTFSDRTDIPAAKNPSAIFSGDLDGDGKPDLIVACADSNVVAVYRNTSTPGAISFVLQAYYPTASPGAVAAGDLNGDGKPDMVVSNSLGSSITLFKNTSSPGTISFASNGNYPTGSTPSQAVIADLNGDGKPEVIVASSGDNEITVYTNASSDISILLLSELNLPAGNYPSNVAVADLDGDGKPDLASENYNGNTFSVFMNTGTAGSAVSFAAKNDFATGASPAGIAAGDLDGDGKPDLAVSNSTDNTVSIFRNTSTPGTIAFASRMDKATGMGPAALMITDLDGDGKPDLAIVNSHDVTLSVLKNISTAGTMGWVPKEDYPSDSTAKGLTITDLDGDGKPDLATTSPSINTFSFFHSKAAIAPVITAFSPSSGITGTSVVITGTNFTGTTAVSFGGIPASSFTVNSPTSITAVVGQGSGGLVTVNTSTGTGSLNGFAFKPAIISFTPMNGQPGTIVTITGKALSSITSVSFGGTAAGSFNILSDSSISAVVGPGASGNVLITSPYGEDSLAGFTYTAPDSVSRPAISAFAPTSGSSGDTITIHGAHFTGALSVRFGTVQAGSFQILSDSVMTAIVGSGSSGQLIVSSPAGADSLAGFIYIDTTTTPPPPPPPADTAFQLIQFTAAAASSQVFLQWEARNEKSVTYYVLQRSSDSLQFSAISSMQPSGKDSAFQIYNYTDAVPGPGINYYRLKIEDTAGNSTYSPVVAIQFGGAPLILSLHPNPASSYLMVLVPDISTPSQFQFVDVAGQVLRTIPVSQNTQEVRIDLTGVLEGVYKLIWRNGVSYSFKTVLILR